MGSCISVCCDLQWSGEGVLDRATSWAGGCEVVRGRVRGCATMLPLPSCRYAGDAPAHPRAARRRRVLHGAAAAVHAGVGCAGALRRLPGRKLRVVQRLLGGPLQCWARSGGLGQRAWATRCGGSGRCGWYSRCLQGGLVKRQIWGLRVRGTTCSASVVCPHAASTLLSIRR